MNIVLKIVIAIVGVVLVSKFIAPLLMGGALLGFGVIILILIYIAILAWLLDWFPRP